MQSVALDAVSMAPESAFLESVTPAIQTGGAPRRRAGRTPFDPEGVSSGGEEPTPVSNGESRAEATIRDLQATSKLAGTR